jgi:20S proteasome subunit alpha 4
LLKFIIKLLFTGFDDDGTPHLYQTDPAGVYTEWKANAIGRNAKTVREVLEKNFPSNDVQNVTEHDTIKLAVKALLEVVQLGGKCHFFTLFLKEIAIDRKRTNCSIKVHIF